MRLEVLLNELPIKSRGSWIAADGRLSKKRFSSSFVFRVTALDKAMG